MPQSEWAIMPPAVRGSCDLVGVALAGGLAGGPDEGADRGPGHTSLAGLANGVDNVPFGF